MIQLNTVLKKCLEELQKKAKGKDITDRMIFDWFIEYYRYKEVFGKSVNNIKDSHIFKNFLSAFRGIEDVNTVYSSFNMMQRFLFNYSMLLQIVIHNAGRIWKKLRGSKQGSR